MQQIIDESVRLLSKWWLAGLAFLVCSAAINVVISRLQTSLEGTELYENEWFQRGDPLYPVILGLIIAPVVGPHVVPSDVEIPLILHLASGVLMGAFAAYSYEFWRQSLKGLKECVQRQLSGGKDTDA